MWVFRRRWGSEQWRGCGGRVEWLGCTSAVEPSRLSQLRFFRVLPSLHPSSSSPAFIMSILLSDRQTDDLYVSHVPTTTCLQQIADINQPLQRHKAILDYLHNAGFTKSFEQLKEDTKLVRLK